MLDALFSGVIEVSLGVSVLITVLLLLSPLLRKTYTVNWRYWVWLMLAVRLLLPFNLSLPRPPINITMPHHRIAYQSPTPTLSPPITNIQPADHRAPAEPTKAATAKTVSITEVSVAAWLLGISVSVLYQSACYLLLRRSIKQWSYPATDSRVLALFEEMRTSVKAGPIGLCICRKVESPMLTGFFSPVILLPSERYTSEQLRVIFTHELVHHRRHDLWAKLLLLCANALHWFNPMIYLMTACAHRDMELSCDAEVVEGTDLPYRRHYSQTILSLIQGRLPRLAGLSTHLHGGKKSLKQRLEAILDMGEKRRGLVPIGAIALVAVLGVALIACTQATPIKTVGPLPDGSADRVNSLLLIITSSPLHSSNSADYIREHRPEYDAIVAMGSDALPHLMSILESGDYGLRGVIVMHLCTEILREPHAEADEQLYIAATAALVNWNTLVGNARPVTLPGFTSDEVTSARAVVEEYYRAIAEKNAKAALATLTARHNSPNNILYGSEKRTLLSVDYDEQDPMRVSRGSINLHAVENIIVFKVSFSIGYPDGIGGPWNEGVYKNWSMILVREGATQAWLIDDQGY